MRPLTSLARQETRRYASSVPRLCTLPHVRSGINERPMCAVERMAQGITNTILGPKCTTLHRRTPHLFWANDMSYEDLATFGTYKVNASGPDARRGPGPQVVV